MANLDQLTFEGSECNVDRMKSALLPEWDKYHPSIKELAIRSQMVIKCEDQVFKGTEELDGVYRSYDRSIAIKVAKTPFNTQLIGTFRHEFGHFIDDALGLSKTKSFIKALDSDIKLAKKSNFFEYINEKDLSYGYSPKEVIARLYQYKSDAAFNIGNWEFNRPFVGKAFPACTAWFASTAPKFDEDLAISLPRLTAATRPHTRPLERLLARIGVEKGFDDHDNRSSIVTTALACAEKADRAYEHIYNLPRSVAAAPKRYVAAVIATDAAVALLAPGTLPLAATLFGNGVLAWATGPSFEPNPHLFPIAREIAARKHVRPGPGQGGPV